MRNESLLENRENTGVIHVLHSVELDCVSSLFFCESRSRMINGDGKWIQVCNASNFLHKNLSTRNLTVVFLQSIRSFGKAFCLCLKLSISRSDVIKLFNFSIFSL